MGKSDGQAFGKHLKQERLRRGWSQADVASRINTDTNNISRWERGTHTPGFYARQRLLEVFEITAEAFGLLSSENVEEVPAHSLQANHTHAEVSAKGNPFTYGNPISDPARFFGRLREAEQVFSRLRNVEFESSSLVGERRIGKTSLLNYLAHPNIRRMYGLDPSKYLFVYVDLQMVNSDTTPARLWQQLLRQMARGGQNMEIRQVIEQTQAMGSIDSFALADVFDSLDENGQYVVFLLDEFENVTKNPNFGQDFFYSLRSLAIHHHLSLITSSRHELIELCHSEAIRSSPFFNIFANINLRLFSEREAQQLISTSLAGTEVSFTDVEVTSIFRIAGYHPYFLQIACSFLFNAYAMKLDPNERLTFLQKAFREEARPHLEDYWRISNEQEKIVLTALALAERQRKADEYSFSIKQLQDLYARSDQTLAGLEKRGLVACNSDTYSLLNTSFGAWICNEITIVLYDQQSYDEWSRFNNRLMERLSPSARKEIATILPRINATYRELIIDWVSEARYLATVTGALTTALELL